MGTHSLSFSLCTVFAPLKADSASISGGNLSPTLALPVRFSESTPLLVVVVVENLKETLGDPAGEGDDAGFTGRNRSLCSKVVEARLEP